MFVNNEWSNLKIVILGINNAYKDVLNVIKKKLEENSIKVVRPIPYKRLHITHSLWRRDSSIVIDNQAILLQLQNIDNEYRKLEYKTIPMTNSIIQNNDKIKLEGGDILQMKNKIFVGIHKRTNVLRYRWLKTIFPNKSFIQIKHTALHLDCCFCILPNHTILYSRKYIETLPQYCYKHFNCINIDSYIKGDPNLATNFLFLDEKTIIIDNQFITIRTLLRQFGFKLIVIDLKGIYKQGGSIRCLTQPLYRV